MSQEAIAHRPRHLPHSCATCGLCADAERQSFARRLHDANSYRLPSGRKSSESTGYGNLALWTARM
jgi:hypothetical protein